MLSLLSGRKNLNSNESSESNESSGRTKASRGFYKWKRPPFHHPPCMMMMMENEEKKKKKKKKGIIILEKNSPKVPTVFRFRSLSPSSIIFFLNINHQQSSFIVVLLFDNIFRITTRGKFPLVDQRVC